MQKLVKYIALVLIFGTLISFKVYAGLLALAGFGLLTIYRLVLKKDWQLLLLFISSLALSLVLFLPANSGGSTLVAWSPLWLVDSMIDFPDRLGWQRLALARQAYFFTGNIFKLVGAEVIGERIS